MTEAEEIWRRKTDEEILAAASILRDYTEEGQRIILTEADRRGLNVALVTEAANDLQMRTGSSSRRCAYCDTRILFGGKQEGELRFCNEECRRACIQLSVSYKIPEQVIKERVAAVFNGTCPRCGGPGPVDVRTSHRIVSFVVMTSWSNRLALTCRSCGNKAKLRDTALSLGLGWWGLPWGLVMTPVQVFRNVAGLLGAPGPSQPSSHLERVVRLGVANQLVDRPANIQTEPPRPLQAREESLSMTDPTSRNLKPASPDDNAKQLSAALTSRWLAAFEAGRLNPPRDVHDPSAWDDFWKNHIEVGAIDQGFSDAMSSDPLLPALLARRGARTILCAGNGLSSEALSLCLLGFNVTALDISAVPSQAIGAAMRNREHPVHRIPGFCMGDDDSVSVEHSGSIATELRLMHRSDDYALRGGGTLLFVTGDLMNANLCPGPFDVVVERRTLQLFPEHEQASALAHMVARLADSGVFVSHQHVGAWRPGDVRTHYAEAWLRSRGFVFQFAAGHDNKGSAAPLAFLRFSTG